jgi:Polysaccharide biosynthesis protein
VSLRKSEVLQSIWETAPVGLEPVKADVLDRLSLLTQGLIDISGRDRLAVDPFAEVYKRKVEIDELTISTILRNKVILITGGRGFVGTNLIAKLQQFGVKKIVAIDITADQNQIVAIDAHNSVSNILINYHQCDVRNISDLHAVFAAEQPQIVFHLAAQRLPGLAETQVYETVSTNLFGCVNIIECCETYGVEGCIFSSTGKASRYFTPDIYAATKKIAEWLFSDRAKYSICQFGIVRFTHVVENSPISEFTCSRSIYLRPKHRRISQPAAEVSHHPARWHYRNFIGTRHWLASEYPRCGTAQNLEVREKYSYLLQRFASRLRTPCFHGSVRSQWQKRSVAHAQRFRGRA